MGCRFWFGVLCTAVTNEILKLGMFLIVAIDTEQFPVAAIIGVVVMIVVDVMNGQFGQVLAIELPGASPAYPRVNF